MNTRILATPGSVVDALLSSARQRRREKADAPLVVPSAAKVAALVALRHEHRGNGADRQRDRLLAALQAVAEVSTREAVEHLDILRPGSRVFELREAGHVIGGRWIAQLSEAGEVHKVMAYRLIATAEAMA